MKVGFQICSFTYPGGAASIARQLRDMVQAADEAGLDSIWVMDHFFQIRGVGPTEDPMLEGWTTLGWMAALTKRVRLGLMVGGVHYRSPGLWVKAATTLDVLSGGRAWLGIGAAWNEYESRSLGFPFPPRAERFEMLEETLRIAHELFAGERGSEAAFEGRHYHATRLLNSPQSISRPRVPIMVGGGGERKTLRLVAQYADGSNVFGGPEECRHKFDVLQAHCEAVGRDYHEIERSNLVNADLTTPGSAASRGTSAAQLVDRLGELSDAGVQHAIISDDHPTPEKVGLLGSAVLPQVRGL
jgi:F420-dependent oxidoreductase-like protein